MARALRAWAINRGGKNLVRNLRYGPRTWLVRGIFNFFSSVVTDVKPKIQCYSAAFLETVFVV